MLKYYIWLIDIFQVILTDENISEIIQLCKMMLRRRYAVKETNIHFMCIALDGGGI